VVFVSKTHVGEAILDAIKATSRRWFLAKQKGGICMYFERFSNPLLCLNS